MRSLPRSSALLILAAALAAGEGKRVLYLTHSAGYRHDVLPFSADVVRGLSPQLQVTATEDVAQLDSLEAYDAVLFYTSGELPLGEARKRALLEFVRSGKGFAGVHSATDTLYTWPEYLELVGARFKEHPWVEVVPIDVEDPDHPAAAHLAPSFSILDEIYVFNEFSRARSRVLMTFGDHPLAWCHPYGQGRVFYTALGHFENTWRDARFQEMLRQALLWVTRQRDGDAAPRPPVEPVMTALGNAASLQPRDTIAPGSLISIFGRHLTSGSTLPSAGALRLAGATVKLNGAPVPLIYASPSQINAFVPHDLKPNTVPEPGYRFELSTPGGSIARNLNGAEATPGVFTVTVHPGYVTIWATGLGPVERLAPRVALAGNPARVLFAGLSPVHPGLYQVNAEVPAGLSGPVRLDFESSGATHSVSIHLLSAP